MGPVLAESETAGDAEDLQWTRDFQAGKEQGFNRLVLKHKDRIFGLCLRILSNREEADDAAQETFVRVYHGLQDFRHDAKFSSWLYRIAVNTCKNKLASRAHRDARDHADVDALESTAAESIGSASSHASGTEGYPLGYSPSPAQVLEAKRRGERIEAAIARLPEEQRILIVLRDVEGRSYEEIAESTGLNPGTVKSRLNRGRAQLQEWLREVLLLGLLLALAAWAWHQGTSGPSHERRDAAAGMDGSHG